MESRRAAARGTAYLLGESLVVEHDGVDGDVERREAREHRAHVRVLRLLQPALVHENAVAHLRLEASQLRQLANWALNQATRVTRTVSYSYVEDNVTVHKYSTVQYIEHQLPEITRRLHERIVCKLVSV